MDPPPAARQRRGLHLIKEEGGGVQNWRQPGERQHVEDYGYPELMAGLIDF